MPINIRNRPRSGPKPKQKIQNYNNRPPTKSESDKDLPSRHINRRNALDETNKNRREAIHLSIQALELTNRIREFQISQTPRVDGPLGGDKLDGSEFGYFGLGLAKNLKNSKKMKKKI